MTEATKPTTPATELAEQQLDQAVGGGVAIPDATGGTTNDAIIIHERRGVAIPDATGGTTNDGIIIHDLTGGKTNDAIMHDRTRN